MQGNRVRTKTSMPSPIRHWKIRNLLINEKRKYERKLKEQRGDQVKLNGSGYHYIKDPTGPI
jgi:hypothetical protein